MLAEESKSKVKGSEGPVHAESEEPPIEEAKHPALNEEPTFDGHDVHIKVNGTHSDVKCQGKLGYVVGKTDSWTFKIIFDDDELNVELGGKGMWSSSFMVFGNTSL